MNENTIRRLAESDLISEMFEDDIDEVDHLIEAQQLLHDTLEFLERGLIKSNLSGRAWAKAQKLERQITEFLEGFE